LYAWYEPVLLMVQLSAAKVFSAFDAPARSSRRAVLQKIFLFPYGRAYFPQKS
jgi:hypothetical protein